MNKYIPFETYASLPSQSRGKDSGMTLDGTWGRGAAGILIVSDLSEVLLLKRSWESLDPFTWGIPGGARKETSQGMEDPLVTAVTESVEEMRGLPRGRIREVPYVFNGRGSFTYETFILEIDPEERELFVPRLNFEHTDSAWVRRDNPEHRIIHPGVKDVLANYQF